MLLLPWPQTVPKQRNKRCYKLHFLIYWCHNLIASVQCFVYCCCCAAVAVVAIANFAVIITLFFYVKIGLKFNLQTQQKETHTTRLTSRI